MVFTDVGDAFTWKKLKERIKLVDLVEASFIAVERAKRSTGHPTKSFAVN